MKLILQHRSLIDIKIKYVMSTLSTWRMNLLPSERSIWSWRPFWLLGSSIRGRSRVLRTALWSSVIAERVCGTTVQSVNHRLMSTKSSSPNLIKTNLHKTTLVYQSIRLRNKRVSEIFTYIDSFSSGNEVTNRKIIHQTK